MVEFIKRKLNSTIKLYWKAKGREEALQKRKLHSKEERREREANRRRPIVFHFFNFRFLLILSFLTCLLWKRKTEIDELSERSTTSPNQNEIDNYAPCAPLILPVVSYDTHLFYIGTFCKFSQRSSFLIQSFSMIYDTTHHSWHAISATFTFTLSYFSITLHSSPCKKPNLTPIL